MNFEEIIAEAERTRDSIYGIQILDQVHFLKDAKAVDKSEPRETEAQRINRIKAENVKTYQKMVEEKSTFAPNGRFIDIDSELDYEYANHDTGELHAKRNIFVNFMIDIGLIKDFDELS